MNTIALRIHVCADDWAAESTIIASNKLRYSSNNENPCLISEIYDSLFSEGTCDKMLRDDVGNNFQEKKHFLSFWVTLNSLRMPPTKRFWLLLGISFIQERTFSAFLLFTSAKKKNHCKLFQFRNRYECHLRNSF